MKHRRKSLEEEAEQVDAWVERVMAAVLVLYIFVLFLAAS